MAAPSTPYSEPRTDVLLRVNNSHDDAQLSSALTYHVLSHAESSNHNFTYHSQVTLRGSLDTKAWRVLGLTKGQADSSMSDKKGDSGQGVVHQFCGLPRSSNRPS